MPILNGAGTYRYYLTRQVSHKDATGKTTYTDAGSYWCAVDELSAMVAPGVGGGSVIDAKQVIRIRNQVDLNTQDRLYDPASGFLYNLVSMYWSFPTNETVVNAIREQWSKTH